jgi:hypothetical protein
MKSRLRVAQLKRIDRLDLKAAESALLHLV